LAARISSADSALKAPDFLQRLFNQLTPGLQRYTKQIASAVNEQVEDIELEVRVWAAVLQGVERGASAFVDCNHFAVDQRVRRELLTSLGDLWEPGSEG
jgi:hypothetical protein